MKSEVIYNIQSQRWSEENGLTFKTFILKKKTYMRCKKVRTKLKLKSEKKKNVLFKIRRLFPRRTLGNQKFDNEMYGTGFKTISLTLKTYLR